MILRVVYVPKPQSSSAVLDELEEPQPPPPPHPSDHANGSTATATVSYIIVFIFPSMDCFLKENLMNV